MLNFEQRENKRFTVKEKIKEATNGNLIFQHRTKELLLKDLGRKIIIQSLPPFDYLWTCSEPPGEDLAHGKIINNQRIALKAILSPLLSFHPRTTCAYFFLCVEQLSESDLDQIYTEVSKLSDWDSDADPFLFVLSDYS